MVSIVVARGTTKLCCNLALLELVELLVEAIHKHHYLLAQACGACRLTVGLGEHRHVFPLLGIYLQLVYQLLHQRTIYIVERLLYRQWHRSVVDVLRGESEVYELLELLQATDLVELLLYEVFHSLHIVVGHLLDVLHALCSCLVEAKVDVAQCVE